MNKFQVGDIACFNDPLFDDGAAFITSYFVVSNIYDGMYYSMLPLNDDEDANDSYLITWVDGSSKWSKVS